MGMDIARLMFIWKILLLPASCIYNTLARSRITDIRFGLIRERAGAMRGPMTLLYCTAQKYNLVDYVHSLLDTTVVIPKNVWKRLVTDCVRSRYRARWTMTCMLYPKLRLFRLVVPQVAASVWWQVCRRDPAVMKACKLMVRIAAGEHGLRTGRARFVVHTCVCQHCDMYEAETVEHVIYQCSHPRVAAVRDRVMQNIADLMPRPMKDDVAAMTNEQKSVLFLSGLGGGYVAEWQHIYVNIAQAISNIYKMHIELSLLNA